MTLDNTTAAALPALVEHAPDLGRVEWSLKAARLELAWLAGQERWPDDLADLVRRLAAAIDDVGALRSRSRKQRLADGGSR